MSEIKTFYQFSNGQKLEICYGDLTQERVHAIVNAANSQLMHGGGIAAAIAHKGGPQIDEESRKWVKDHGPVSHAKPAYTNAGSLPCRFVIHAVGPVWGDGDEEAKLASAIQGSLDLAKKLDLTSIAFPAISTGIFGFPKDLAARVFYLTLDNYFKKNASTPIQLVRIVLFDQPTLTIFLNEFSKWQRSSKHK